MEEFGEACELLRKHLPEHDTKEQLMDMCKMMDINKDGLVDLNEFLETFRLCEQGRIKLTIIDEHKTKTNTEVSIVISDCDSLNVDENNKKATTSNGHNGRKKETAVESDESDDIDVDDNDVDKDQRKTIGTNGNVIQKSSSASTTSSVSNKKDDSPKKQRVKLKDMYL